MTAARLEQLYTPERYLAIEREAETRSELIGGDMVAMSGASLSHERISGNIVRHAGNALDKSPCEVVPSNLRVRVRSTNYVYPDATIVCGKPELVDDGHLDTLLNPTVIFEVLSDSTGYRDRDIKWALYQRIESLVHYVMLHQNQPRVEVLTRRSANDWLLHVEQGLAGSIGLSEVGIEIQMAALYERVEFTQSDDMPD